MDKQNFLTDLSSRFNRRKLIMRAAPIAVAVPLLGALAPSAHAQEISPIPAYSQNEFREITPQQSHFQIGGARLYTWAQSSTNDLHDFIVNHTITDLGGANVMVTTSLSSYQWFTADSLGAIYIVQYSDANGYHSPNGSYGNALFINGAQTLTMTIHARNCFVIGLVEIKYFS
ncbi:MAG TPA: hypothetical protein VGD98_06900 [Ktedonobacteraceae bacterium]